MKISAEGTNYFFQIPKDKVKRCIKKKWMKRNEVEGGIFILARCEFHFIRVHENLVQHPSNYISIVNTLIVLPLTIRSFVLSCVYK